MYHPLVVLGRPAGDVIRDIGELYVATPALARRLGVDLDRVPDRTDVLTPHDGAAALRQHAATTAASPVVELVDRPAYSSGPASLVTPAALGRNGWEAAPAGWFVESPEPLTGAQIALRSEHGRRRGAHRRDP